MVSTRFPQNYVLVGVSSRFTVPHQPQQLKQNRSTTPIQSRVRDSLSLKLEKNPVRFGIESGRRFRNIEHFCQTSITQIK